MMELRSPISARERKSVWIVFEVILWAFIVIQAGVGIIAPLVGLAHQGDPPGTPGSLIGLSGGGNRLDLPLTEEGLKVVYGAQASLPPGGTVQIGDIYLTPATTAQVTLRDTGPAEFVATVGSMILGAALVITVCVILLMIVRTGRRDDPFDPRNTARLFILANTILIGAAVVQIVRVVASAIAASSAELVPFVDWAALADLRPFFLGFGVMVLAVVFNQGARLRADAEGLV
jgi:hypothetical protein